MVLESVIGILDVLDAHSGAVTAIATLTLVVATVLLVRATVFLANINAKMWQAQHRPWLHFIPSYAMGEAMVIDSLVIANAGNGPAFDVKFRFDLDSIPVIERRNKDFYDYETPFDGFLLDDRPINVLSPGGRILLIDELLNARFKKAYIRPKKIRINDISYLDINGIRIHQSPVIIEGTMPI